MRIEKQEESMVDVFSMAIFVLYIYLVVCFGISMAISYTLSSIGQYSVLQIFFVLALGANLGLALITYLLTPTETFSNLISLIILQEIVLIGIPLFFAFIIETKIYEFDSESIIPFVGVFGGLLSATIIGTILSVPAQPEVYIFITIGSGILIFFIPVLAVLIYTLFYRDEWLDSEDLPPY